VTISLGYPDVLFDAGGKIMSVGGARGQAKKTLVQGSGINREPVVTPDGKTLVFQRGQCCQPGYKFRPATAQIWAMTLGQPSSARPLTTPGVLDQRPAISPDGKTVAFIAENRGLDPDLCFARLDQTSAQPSCITDSSTLVDRPAWAPDGKSIVVVSRPASGTGTELLQYTSSVANSPNAADWTKGAVITQALHPQRAGAQVLSAAFSPDTKKPTLALTANWRAGAFILWLVPLNGGQLGKPRPVVRIPACELAWLPDGKALVVSQRGPKCDGPATIARVDPATPGGQMTLTQVVVDSGNPVFTPFGR
jgi:Tol biopolymer transport system component